jgi:U3 small nucleolar ribonucleoprotein component
MTEKTANPLCQTCQRERAYKKVLTANKKSKRWKCLSCIKKQSISFIKIKGDKKL